MEIISKSYLSLLIPQISENITQSNNIEIPEKCPVCGEITEIRQLNEGKTLYCTNPNCKAQLVHSLEHFTSRDAANIEGMSEATIEKFVEKEFLKDYTDLYELSRYEEEIKSMEGFGEKSYQKLIKSIENSKKIQLPNFIYALGISNVGLSNAKLLCKQYDYDLEKIKTASEEELIEIEGFGEVIAYEIHKYFNNEKNLELLNKVLSKLDIQKEEIEQDNKFAGMTFVITGDTNHFKNRKELQAEIERLGGKVSSSVSSKTSYLINNDNTSNSSKNKKAKELNIPIITEEEFLKM